MCLVGVSCFVSGLESVICVWVECPVLKFSRFGISATQNYELCPTVGIICRSGMSCFCLAWSCVPWNKISTLCRTIREKNTTPGILVNVVYYTKKWYENVSDLVHTM